MFLWLSLLFTVSVANAAIIGWNDFSGSENWIDYSDWLAMPNPVYYQGCTFTEQGSGAGGPGWRDSDWTQYFENASNEYPGLSLGYGMADNHGITEIKVEFTDYSDIKRIGLLASTSVATTYELQAYDISHNLKLDTGYTFKHIEGGRMFEFEKGNFNRGQQGFHGDMKVHGVHAGIRWNFQ